MGPSAARTLTLELFKHQPCLVQAAGGPKAKCYQPYESVPGVKVRALWQKEGIRATRSEVLECHSSHVSHGEQRYRHHQSGLRTQG